MKFIVKNIKRLVLVVEVLLLLFSFNVKALEISDASLSELQNAKFKDKNIKIDEERVAYLEDVKLAMARVSYPRTYNLPTPFVQPTFHPDPETDFFGSQTDSMPIMRVDVDEEDETRNHSMALTFDSAYINDYTYDILDLLDKYDAKATFFMTADFMRKNMDQVADIIKRGHEIGNHSTNHPNFNKIKDTQVIKEVWECHEILRSKLGVEMSLFRYPYGAYSEKTMIFLKTLGYYPIQWSADSADWKNEGIESILIRLGKDSFFPGAIILFHNGATYTKDTLPYIFEIMKEKGLKCVRVSDLIYKHNFRLHKDGYQIDNDQYEALINKGKKKKVVATVSQIQTVTKNTNLKVNELGKVPIMMYHGIVNVKSEETEFVGGNYDKDGYARTAEAFRDDLEFYYKHGYRMIRLKDYLDGKIDCPKGTSPIILTFDDGSDNNIKVTGLDKNKNIIIDKDSAIGILEEKKKKYPDFNVTATFFLTKKLFRQDYSKKAMEWLINNGYDIGNHTYDHVSLAGKDIEFAKYQVAMQYENLKSVIGDKYVDIVALPLGQPNNYGDPVCQAIYDISIGDNNHKTSSLLKVGWEPEYSPFDKRVNIRYLKRVRAYDNNGEEYDLKSTFELLEKERYVSDGDIDTITIDAKDENKLGNTYGLTLKTLS